MHITSNEKLSSLSKHILSLLFYSQIYRKPSSKIIFICGINEETSLRQKFICYSAKKEDDLRFFEAEKALAAIRDAIKDKDLLTLENQMAEYTDCVLIVLEGPGAIAELGAFANNEKILELLIVINDKEHEPSSGRPKNDSFISQGPLKLVKKGSIYKPSILYEDIRNYDFDKDPRLYEQIKKTLRSRQRLLLNNATAIPMQSPFTITDVEKRDKLLILSDVVKLFSPISEKELKALVKDEINIEIGLLLALNVIKECTIDSIRYFYSVRNQDYSYRYLCKHSIFLKQRTKIICFYKKHSPERLEVLKRR